MIAQKKQFQNKTIIIPIYLSILLLSGMFFIYIFEEIGMTNRELNLDMRSDTMIKLTSRAIKYHKENNSLNWLISSSNNNNEISDDSPGNCSKNFHNNTFFEEKINQEKVEKLEKINNILLDAIA